MRWKLNRRGSLWPTAHCAGGGPCRLRGRAGLLPAVPGILPGTSGVAVRPRRGALPPLAAVAPRRCQPWAWPRKWNLEAPQIDPRTAHALRDGHGSGSMRRGASASRGRASKRPSLGASPRSSRSATRPALAFHPAPARGQRGADSEAEHAHGDRRGRGARRHEQNENAPRPPVTVAGAGPAAITSSPRACFPLALRPPS